jgi:hypothetical protein
MRIYVPSCSPRIQPLFLPRIQLSSCSPRIQPSFLLRIQLPSGSPHFEPPSAPTTHPLQPHPRPHYASTFPVYLTLRVNFDMFGLFKHNIKLCIEIANLDSVMNEYMEFG